MNSNLTCFISYLKTSGYNIDEEKGHYQADKPSKYGFSFTDYEGGVNMYCRFEASEYALENRAHCLEILNSLTYDGSIAYFVMSERDIIISYWFCGKHTKTDYKNLTEMWEFDIWYAFNEKAEFINLLAKI